MTRLLGKRKLNRLRSASAYLKKRVATSSSLVQRILSRHGKTALMATASAFLANRYLQHKTQKPSYKTTGTALSLAGEIIQHSSNGLKRRSVGDYLKMRFAKAAPAARRLANSDHAKGAVKVGKVAAVIGGAHYAGKAIGNAAMREGDSEETRGIRQKAARTALLAPVAAHLLHKNSKSGASTWRNTLKKYPQLRKSFIRKTMRADMAAGKVPHSSAKMAGIRGKLKAGIKTSALGGNIYKVAALGIGAMAARNALRNRSDDRDKALSLNFADKFNQVTKKFGAAPKSVSFLGKRRIRVKGAMGSVNADAGMASAMNHAQKYAGNPLEHIKQRVARRKLQASLRAKMLAASALKSKYTAGAIGVGSTALAARHFMKKGDEKPKGMAASHELSLDQNTEFVEYAENCLVLDATNRKV